MIHCSSMEGFSSSIRRGLLPFEIEGYANLVELDRRPRFTPMIWSGRRTLGFGLKKEKKKIKEKKRKIRKETFVFPLYFEKLVFSLRKRLIQKGIHFSKLTRVSIGKKLNFWQRMAVDGAKIKKTAFIVQGQRCNPSLIGMI